MKYAKPLLFLLVLVNFIALVTIPWTTGWIGNLNRWPTNGYVAGGIAVIGGFSVIAGIFLTFQRLRRKNNYPILLGPTLALTGFITGVTFAFFALVLNACMVGGNCL